MLFKFRFWKLLRMLFFICILMIVMTTNEFFSILIVNILILTQFVLLQTNGWGGLVDDNKTKWKWELSERNKRRITTIHVHILQWFKYALTHLFFLMNLKSTLINLQLYSDDKYVHVSFFTTRLIWLLLCYYVKNSKNYLIIAF